jgi:hypothetical protein
LRVENIRRGRRQLLLGLLFLCIAYGMIQLVLLPQFSELRMLQAMKRQTINGERLSSKLMLALNAKQPDDWQKKILDTLSTTASESRVMITEVEGGLQSAHTDKKYPAGVQSIPLTLHVYGSYSALQLFIEKISAGYPSLLVRSVNFTNADKPTLSPTESPILKGVIQLNIFALN